MSVSEKLQSFSPEWTVDVVIVGAGAAGLVAALAAAEDGAEVLVIERDVVPRGSTALSAGLIPAAGTRFQREAGIEDNAELFASDILHKAHDEPDSAFVGMIAATSGPAVDWLADSYGLPFSLVQDFNYPGHSRLRMHGLPTRAGAELVERLRAAVERMGVTILCETLVISLATDAVGQVVGLTCRRKDGRTEDIGCRALVVACNGYGGDHGLVEKHIPEMRDAIYFGHSGNCGDAVRWGAELGARLRFMSGYQGHGSVAHPHGILISWATIMSGGFQVNRDGLRFSDETQGYSEQAVEVLRQPDGLAFTIFDDQIAGVCRQFEDFRAAEAAGAIVVADTIEALAKAFKLPEGSLETILDEIATARTASTVDSFGREWSGQQPLAPPYCGVRVTGALFHTQGGLDVDVQARVLHGDGQPFTNLFAAGGAAAGVSGSQAAGYLSGNGLLTAVTLGRIAGREAARLAVERTRFDRPSNV